MLWQFWIWNLRSSTISSIFCCLIEPFSSLHVSGLQPNVVRRGEADAEPENVMTDVQTKELSQQCGESDSEEDPEETSEVEIYEESDEDPGNTIFEVSEDDPEEEIKE